MISVNGFEIEMEAKDAGVGLFELLRGDAAVGPIAALELAAELLLLGQLLRILGKRCHL